MLQERADILLDNAVSILLDTGKACMSDDDIIYELGMTQAEADRYIHRSTDTEPASVERASALIYNATSVMMDTEVVGMTRDEVKTELGMTDEEASEIGL